MSPRSTTTTCLLVCICLLCWLRFGSLIHWGAYITASPSSAISDAPPALALPLTVEVREEQPDDNKSNTGTVITSQWPDTPTIVVGMPKAGTKSIWAYFKECGGIRRVSHYNCGGMPCGYIVRSNIEQGLAPFAHTKGYDVFTQLDTEGDVQKGQVCYFPQIEALEEIHEAHPNATLLLNTRNLDNWAKSVRAFRGMGARLTRCNITGFLPGVGSTNEQLKDLYVQQIRRVQTFVQKYPSHRLVQVAIDEPNAGEIMEASFGINRSCWGNVNAKLKKNA
mmetsp:Transcript_19131/g.31717  ORF Transcript_19131/g.31717 Transcript_19131/m.31717 type:complete len:279 (+) Transcript_19131:157-993(+)|eukprot:CAMPEP_0119006418 /NCGR_PEP_ID=MMETSP1176-20130426/2283_1 /TAXON_ID=265551 /ORGANISM="Synedropsis recta cf, Strain CCMP1620" /LENGTH=278 /DNA_ID=CAMNT_0006958327 /DNA_START=129 /DNA_END=965 /DNA_ORIENTATION=-